jgi:hypothetical protein
MGTKSSVQLGGEPHDINRRGFLKAMSGLPLALTVRELAIPPRLQEEPESRVVEAFGLQDSIGMAEEFLGNSGDAQQIRDYLAEQEGLQIMIERARAFQLAGVDGTITIAVIPFVTFEEPFADAGLSISDYGLAAASLVRVEADKTTITEFSTYVVEEGGEVAVHTYSADDLSAALEEASALASSVPVQTHPQVELSAPVINIVSNWCYAELATDEASREFHSADEIKTLLTSFRNTGIMQGMAQWHFLRHSSSPGGGCCTCCCFACCCCSC